MNRTKWIQTALCCICLLPGAYVQAQQTYRCGKVFQDRPCDGNQPINAPPASAGAAQSSARPGGYPECARRGEEAQKIVWAKEAGRTEEMQLGASTNAEQKKLISDVYRRRGTSGEMRSTIEADCNAERDRAAQAAALINAGNLLGQQGQPAAPAAPRGPSEADQAAAKRDAVAAAEANKASRCKSLNARLASIREQQRGGASAAAMDRLNRDQADTEKSRRETGC